MRFAFGVLLVALVAATVGLGSAWHALERGWFDPQVRVGAWTVFPMEGDPAASPYAVARLSQRGRVPLGPAEGIALRALTDDAGRPLDPACRYRLTGTVPAASLWTLAVTGRDGRLPSSPTRRFGFTSRSLVWSAGGSIDIRIGPEPQPGNWVATTGLRNMALALHLYDTAVVAAGEVERAAFPAVVREACP